MKINPLTPITGLLLLAGALELQAASGSWTGATDANWSDANWSATPVPGTGNTAIFGGAGNGNTTINLGSGITILDLMFNSGSAAAYTIGAGAAGSQTLSLNNSGAITMNSSYELHQDASTGSLEVGKLADFIVLDRNVLKIPAEEIAQVKVLQTVVGGRVVYQAENF